MTFISIFPSHGQRWQSISLKILIEERGECGLLVEELKNRRQIGLELVELIMREEIT